MLAVVENTDDTAVLHGPACKVTHALAGAFAEEIGTLEVWQLLPDGDRLADSRHLTDLIVNEVGDVHRDIATIAFCPSVLPQIAGDLRNLVDLFFQSGAVG